MTWKHILFEANCIYNFDDNINKAVPNCCKYEPGKIGPFCLSYDKDNHKYCPYLGIGKARSTIAVANTEGEVVNGTCFFQPLNIDEDKWVKSELKWIDKQIEYIRNLLL